MKKEDFLWILTLALFVLFLIYPSTHALFISATNSHPYLVGFAKFAILATMGELLARRLVVGHWEKPGGLLFRAVVWGFLGMLIVIIFSIYATGVKAAMQAHLLPFQGSSLAFAFFTSAIMNTTFAPTMMGFHRLTDTYIDLKLSGKSNITLSDVAGAVDWRSFVSFVCVKTIPFFWIPAHTITFFLPAEYRVLMAAMLSIALGAILSFAKKKSAPVK